MNTEAPTPAKPLVVKESSLDSLFHEMSEWSKRIAQRAHDFFAASGFTHGHDLDDWFKAEQELLKPVALDVKDSEDQLVVTAEVPGFEAADLQVHLNGSHLVIQGKHETAEEQNVEGKTTHSTHKSRQIYRMIELPAAILADKAHAELKNGVLQLKLPKAEEAKQIAVTAA
jgi:HSP20 family protein